MLLLLLVTSAGGAAVSARTAHAAGARRPTGATVQTAAHTLGLADLLAEVDARIAAVFVHAFRGVAVQVARVSGAAVVTTDFVSFAVFHEASFEQQLFVAAKRVLIGARKRPLQ